MCVLCFPNWNLLKLIGIYWNRLNSCFEYVSQKVSCVPTFWSYLATAEHHWLCLKAFKPISPWCFTMVNPNHGRAARTWKRGIASFRSSSGFATMACRRRCRCFCYVDRSPSKKTPWKPVFFHVLPWFTMIHQYCSPVLISINQYYCNHDFPVLPDRFFPQAFGALKKPWRFWRRDQDLYWMRDSTCSSGANLGDPRELGDIFSVYQSHLYWFTGWWFSWNMTGWFSHINWE